MFKLTGISKKYKDQIIFSDVSIDLSNPGLYIFQGGNGSGKSTILKVLAGIIYKSQGKIEKDVSISYLPDKFTMPKLMTSKEYIKSFFNMTKRDNLVDTLINEFQIPNRRIGQLSKGNQQKLGLLQILYTDADCYLLDEPLDGLDEYAKHLIKDIIQKLLINKKIIVMSLHSKNLFNEFKPVIYEVKNGEINKKNRRKKEENEEI